MGFRALDATPVPMRTPSPMCLKCMIKSLHSSRLGHAFTAAGAQLFQALMSLRVGNSAPPKPTPTKTGRALPRAARPPRVPSRALTAPSPSSTQALPIHAKVAELADAQD